MAKVVDFLSSCWDFIDKRDIDKHAVAWAVLAVTIKLMLWSISFASTSPRSGSEIAEILAAVWGPWNIVQAGVIAWYFNARPSALLRMGDGDGDRH